ncbi:MAG: hypothetical protein KF773_37725 [Deltaproteobacteria bacterium]|nr:hypothetical protein [Deltaproteobacteria bacterium]MCW5802346.1 hypothetical protein [Deltaproteobacteria bacterium]
MKDANVTIGELCVGGDWACAHGDFGGLRDVAEQLAERVPEPAHQMLVELADACLADPTRAGELWYELKPVVARRVFFDR